MVKIHSLKVIQNTHWGKRSKRIKMRDDINGVEPYVNNEEIINGRVKLAEILYPLIINTSWSLKW